jgi:hypothetical protein
VRAAGGLLDPGGPGSGPGNEAMDAEPAGDAVAGRLAKGA